MEQAAVQGVALEASGGGGSGDAASGDGATDSGSSGGGSGSNSAGGIDVSRLWPFALIAVFGLLLFYFSKKTKRKETAAAIKKP